MISAAIITLSQTESFRTIELDLPESTVGILLALFGIGLVGALTVWTSLRDSRFLKTAWRIALLVPRIVVLLGLLVILINPRERTQTSQIQRSRVGVLFDTSVSMAYPATDELPTEGDAAETRSTTAQRLLISDGLLNELSRTHSVSVYSFDTTLEGPLAVLSEGQTLFTTDSASAATASVDDDVARVNLDEDGSSANQDDRDRWGDLLQPNGAETRLGESLHQLIGQLSGRTLSGIVIVSDGRSNAGLDLETARLRAERSDTRLVTVGVGGTRPAINLRIAGMQSPSDVHRGDPFDLTVVVQGNGTTGQGGTVQLYQQSAGSDGNDRRKVDEQPFQFSEDGLPVEVGFQQQIAVPGHYEYIAIAELADKNLKELIVDDNQRRREVEVTDRKLKVLVISSGPMRDYQFVRNLLYRHSGIESDVWLQSVDADSLGFVSQEAEKLLTEFPATEAELFDYDVIVAFDANWSLLSAQQQKFLNRWVDEHSGGIVFVAGELFTPELARDADRYRDIAVLYPVVLNRTVLELRLSQGADKPWPVLLTPEGRSSEFLKIADATGRSDVDLWKTFGGIYRSYPVQAVRDGAIVLAEYGNPRARTQHGQPPFLASQYYGRGRTMFVSSAETWRLRAISPEGHQRFWTGLVREVGQGRRSRGRSRGLLLTDRSEVSPGQTVTIRAQLYDSRMQPLQRDSVPISVVDADGRPVSVPDQLRSDGRRPGQFVNTFRPGRQGQFRITLPVPESSDVLQADIEVVLPNLEAEDPSQNVPLLTSLTKSTGGRYLNLPDAAAQLASLLPDRSEPVVVDEQLKTLWDRSWVMYLMISLLALEWGLRRVVRLS
ncbi:MAG: hypothetical protein R3C49_11755 [Planctomycetaceae bacterium]